MTQSKLTQKLNQATQKKIEEINSSQKYFFIEPDAIGNLSICFLDTHYISHYSTEGYYQRPFEDLDDCFKLTVAMWVIKICPEEFGDENPQYTKCCNELNRFKELYPKPDLSPNLQEVYQTYYKDFLILLFYIY